MQTAEIDALIARWAKLDPAGKARRRPPSVAALLDTDETRPVVAAVNPQVVTPLRAYRNKGSGARA